MIKLDVNYVNKMKNISVLKHLNMHLCTFFGLKHTLYFKNSKLNVRHKDDRPVDFN